MIGPKPCVFWIYWVVMWLVVTPLVIVVSTIYYTYGQKYVTPNYMHISDVYMDLHAFHGINIYKWPTGNDFHISF